MEQYVIALILGVIEGITECIPVSSTGHMIIKCFVYDLDFRALAQPLQGGCLSAVHGGPQLIFRLSWLCLL